MDLMEIIEDPHGRSSTIIASQLPVGSRYDIIGEESIADAILDRLVYTSHRIELKGRKVKNCNIFIILSFWPKSLRGQHHQYTQLKCVNFLIYNIALNNNIKDYSSK